jgi:hypothetical protein
VTTTESTILSRLLDEGFGPGAWHGADLKAAIADTPDTTAFWRPGVGRHNIAEIALHHAFYAHSVIGRLTGTPPGAFVMEGDDWFELSGKTASWEAIRDTVDATQKRLAGVVAGIAGNTLSSPLDEPARLNLVLGITCHAIYHAGQIQLIKVMAGQR